LHPGADGRCTGSQPHEPEVRILEGSKDALQQGNALCNTRRYNEIALWKRGLSVNQMN